MRTFTYRRERTTGRLKWKPKRFSNEIKHPFNFRSTFSVTHICTSWIDEIKHYIFFARPGCWLAIFLEMWYLPSSPGSNPLTTTNFWHGVVAPVRAAMALEWKIEQRLFAPIEVVVVIGTSRHTVVVVESH